MNRCCIKHQPTAADIHEFEQKARNALIGFAMVAGVGVAASAVILYSIF